MTVERIITITDEDRAQFAAEELRERKCRFWEMCAAGLRAQWPTIPGRENEASRQIGELADYMIVEWGKRWEDQ